MFYYSILLLLAAVGLYKAYWVLDTLPYNIMNSWWYCINTPKMLRMLIPLFRILLLPGICKADHVIVITPWKITQYLYSKITMFTQMG